MPDALKFGTINKMLVPNVNHAWLRDKLNWNCEDDSDLQICPLSMNGETMGAVYRIECGDRSIVLKSSPSKDSPWYENYVQNSLLEREAGAYRFLANSRWSRWPVIAPKCFSFNMGKGEDVLAIEDLSAPDWQVATFARGLDFDEAEATMRTLANLHSRLFCRVGDELSAPFSWLYSSDSKGLIEAIELGIDELDDVLKMRFSRFASFVSCKISEVDIRQCLAEAHDGSIAKSLCHGDCWTGNIMFASGHPGQIREARLIDWQFAMWGNPLSDVALLLVSSLSAELRKQNTDKLLKVYHSALISQITVDYSLAECKLDYKRALGFAVLVAAATLDTYLYNVSDTEQEEVTDRIQSVAIELLC